MLNKFCLECRPNKFAGVVINIMKIKNLADHPQQLGDGRVIGAAGTKVDTREYDLEALAKEDKKRVKDGTLAVIEEVETENSNTEKTEKKMTVETPSQGEKFTDNSGQEKLSSADVENNNAGTKGKSSNGGKK